jgi:hypothetical protein
MKAVIYCIRNNGRAVTIAQAMQAGFRRHGVSVRIEPTWDGKVAGDLTIAYGWIHEPVFTAYRAAGAHFAYWDLGYWNRRPEGVKGAAREGHHRLAVDSWDTADTMARGCPADRWDATRPPVPVLPLTWTVPQRGRDVVLVAGMSGKAAGTHGFRPGEWEGATMFELGQLIDRITRGEAPMQVFRPEFRAKPEKIAKGETIMQALARTRLLVTHHSNAAVDALFAGVPVFARKGVGRLISAAQMIQDNALCIRPYSEDERTGLLRDIAYAQWTPAEMRSGAAWDHIKRLIR